MDDLLYEIKKTAYTEALAQLRMHAPLIWVRNNFFLTVQSASVIFYTSKYDNQNVLLLMILLLISLIVAHFWVKVMRQGQEIQREWRRVAIEMEMQLFSFSLDINSPLCYANKILAEGKNSNISITDVLIKFAFIFRTFWIVVIVVESCHKFKDIKLELIKFVDMLSFCN